MARPSKREKIKLTTEEMENLKAVSRSRTEQHRKVQRASIILKSCKGMTDSATACCSGISTKTRKPKDSIR